MILILMVEGPRTPTSVRICTPTPSCPVAPPCTPVSPTGCRRRSLPSLPPPSRSRSLLLLRGSTPYGSVAPSSPPCPPSSRCGSPSRSTMSVAHPSSTASASNVTSFLHSEKQTVHLIFIQTFFVPTFENKNSYLSYFNVFMMKVLFLKHIS